MKRFILLSLMLLIGWQSQAVVAVDGNWAAQLKDNEEVKNLTPDMIQMQLEEFLDLTPKKYREKTGKRLGLKKALKLKAAQKVVKKKMKKAGEDISSGLYVLLAILGLGWVAMGVMDDWSGSNWITNIILTVLCWLPGVIHALIKKGDYY